MSLKVTPTEIAQRLGLSSASIEQVKQGQIVAEERAGISDKDLCLIVTTTLPASMEKVWEFGQHMEQVADIQEATLATGPVDPTNPSLEDMKFDSDTLSKLARNPAGLFFMSEQEGHLMKEGAKHGKVEETYKQILVDRIKAMWEHGLAGIVAYQGKGRDPRIDLQHGQEAALEVLHDSTVRAEIQAVPSKSHNPTMHSFSWSTQKGRDQAAPTLNHMIRLKNENGSVSITQRFYSGYDYDSMHIVTGVVPTSDGHCVIFYVNHTFTAQVAGIGGTAKRSIGRKMMKGKLIETMTKLKEKLAA